MNGLGLDAPGYHATRAWAEGRAPGSSMGTHVQAYYLKITNKCNIIILVLTDCIVYLCLSLLVNFIQNNWTNRIDFLLGDT